MRKLSEFSILLIAGVLMAGFFSCQVKQNVKHESINPSGFEIKRGVNLSHWLWISSQFGLFL
jgi:hypothetical protein